VKGCLDATPYERPSFDHIVDKLRQTSNLFVKKGEANISMVRRFNSNIKIMLNNIPVSCTVNIVLTMFLSSILSW